MRKITVAALDSHPLTRRWSGSLSPPPPFLSRGGASTLCEILYCKVDSPQAAYVVAEAREWCQPYISAFPGKGQRETFRISHMYSALRSPCGRVHAVPTLQQVGGRRPLSSFLPLLLEGEKGKAAAATGLPPPSLSHFYPFHFLRRRRRRRPRFPSHETAKKEGHSPPASVVCYVPRGRRGAKNALCMSNPSLLQYIPHLTCVAIRAAAAAEEEEDEILITAAASPPPNKTLH